MRTPRQPRIFSRHPSHSILRRNLPPNAYRSVVRLGSITPTTTGRYVEINTVDAVENSMDKLKMKRLFVAEGIQTPKFEHLPEFLTKLNATPSVVELKFPVVVKHRFGSRGAGNYLCTTIEEFKQLHLRSLPDNYIVEEFCNFSREYRIHVSPWIDEHIYTNRKLRRNDADESTKWFRNNQNSVWILETSEGFKKPDNFTDIVAACKKACSAVGLDFGAFDVKTSKPADNGNVKYTIIESNSAPSFGDITAEQYLTYIPEMINKKYDKANTASSTQPA